MTMDGSNYLTPEMMLTFYNRLYPFEDIYKWLNQEVMPTRLFTHREFSFTLAGDVYLRYHSFANTEGLKKQICALNPTRFEIGPVYSARPRDKKTIRPGLFNPVLRELVFDIDMTDYDPVRTCCTGADICTKCWGFIAAAVRVLDRALREEFGYKRLLWVYSGRRGIHLWISDKEAMGLADGERKAIVGWLGVIMGGANARKVNVHVGGKLPPSLQNAMNHLRTIFGSLILETQDCFASEQGTEDLLKLIPETKLAETLKASWSAHPNRSSTDKWQDLAGYRSTYKTLNQTMENIILHYTYPRLDAEVSKHRNHLLKAPFCVHPKTGKVCIPVDVDRVEKFDPGAVPTVKQLLEELDRAGNVVAADGEVVPDWSKTSLKPYVEHLSKHVLEVMQDNMRSKKNNTEMTW